MNFWKVLIAILFTVLLLGHARKTTMVRSVHKVVEQSGISIDHHTVTKQAGEEIPLISARVKGASEVKLIYLIGDDGTPTTVSMNPVPGKEEIFEAAIPVHPKGVRAWYYIEASGQLNQNTITVTLPDMNAPDFKPILLKFEGEVPVYIVILHVLCSFGAIFLAVLAVFAAWDCRRGKISIRESIIFPLWTFILLFIGFLPLGIAMNHYAFGGTWEAFPFGKDITDNKSQIILFFWLITLFLVNGTLFKKSKENDLVTERGYANMVFISFILTIAMYIIPHSL